MKTFRILAIALATFTFVFISSCHEQAPEPKAKYVFLFIGDGMGISQVKATEAYLGSLSGKHSEALNFSKFPVSGWNSTYAANRFITGSAAAGTALATGHKTNIGRISVDTSGKVPLESLAEKAKNKGYRVGIISSVSIDHATPAVFYAHQPSRNMYHEIGLDLANSDIDFFGGGGFKEPVREDVDVLEQAKENGFNYINDVDGFIALQPSDDKILFVNPQLTDGAAMMYAIDQPDDYITLADITEKAIEYLYNDKGFFMMVEGGKIDWLCHANDAAAMVHEVIDFADAVETAISFAQKHPDETLIIITADHETGGLGMGSNLMKYDTDYSLLAHQQLSGEEFNKLISEWRKTNHLNEKGFKIMLKVLEENFGLGGEGAPIPMSEKEISSLKQAFMGLGLSQEGEYGDYSPLTYLSTELVSHHAGLGWTSTKHTGVSVPVFATGVNSEAFEGTTDNTDIPKLIWESLN